METTDGNVKDCKATKLAKNYQLDTIRYQWFVQQCSHVIPAVSGPIITAKATEMNNKLGDPSFMASIGWLNKFKFCHGIQQLDTVGEKLSADNAMTSEYCEKLENIIANHSLV